MGNNEDMKRVLDVLNKTVDLEASAIVSRDGSLIASKIPSDVHPEVFGAMSVTMLVAAETAVGELNKGPTDLVIAQGKDAKIIIMEAGTTALLVAMTNPKAMLGFILVEMERAIRKIETLV